MAWYSREPLEDNLSKERHKSWHLLRNAMILFWCVCTAGALSHGTLWPTKWVPAIELDHQQFADLDLPHGHFGFIATPDGVLGNLPNGSLQQNLVDCDAAGQDTFKEPCYPLLHFFVVFIGFFTLVSPLLPVLIGMIENYSHHRDVRKIGKRLQRCMVYVGAVIFIQVFILAKKRFELATIGNDELFDPSDTIFAFFSVAAIGMREVAHLEATKSKTTQAIKSAVFCLGFLMTYYVFWTARYFHKPVESLIGGLLGMAFASLFHCVTTTKCALESFMSRPSAEPLLG